MNRTKNKLLAVGLALVTLLSACQKEPTGRLELIAEGMGGGNTKMYVDGMSSYWQTGDKVNINGMESTITVNNEQAYVDGEFSADNYCIIFPSNIYQSRADNVVTVNMPATYQYYKPNIWGTGYRQVINAPMAFYGTASDGEVQMKHLTGALNVNITGPSGLKIDRITVSTTQNRVMSGEMSFDLSDLENIGSSATNASDHNSVQMLFDAGNYYNSFSTGTVQIPIPVLSGDVNFVVKVEGHINSTGLKHTFVRTQTTGGHLGRSVIASVSVDMNAGAQDVTTSALFETTTVGSKTYYMIHDALELRLFSHACRGYEYRDDGDDYQEDWVYNSLKYVDANYLVMSDIDMENSSMTAFNRFKGEFNGDYHTISNLDVTTGNDYEWGLFVGGDVKAVENVNFDGLKVTGQTASEYRIAGGALSGSGRIQRVSDVHINNFTVGRVSNYCLVLGGFFGTMGTSGLIENSSVSFTPNQTVTGSNYYVRYLTPAELGGICGCCGNPPTVTNTTVNFNNLTFQSTYAQTKCIFGGVFNSDYYSIPSVEDCFTNVTITGNVTIGGNSLYTAKVYTYGNSNPPTSFVNELEGVDVDGLTINNND